MPTYQMTVEYDGTDWHGWQIQPDENTIQGELEQALGIICRTEVPVVGSGRTDAGVHARGQIAHFILEHPIELSRLANSLNGVLPTSISVRNLQAVPDKFHARFDAISRRYSYTIQTVPAALGSKFSWFIRPSPDIAEMISAAPYLVGKNDYSAFCTTKSETKNRVCNITHASWSPGPPDGCWVFQIEADRFLHGMVRAIVGTLIEIGHGKRSPESIIKIIGSRDRRDAGATAPAKGLVLETVGYPL